MIEAPSTHARPWWRRVLRPLLATSGAVAALVALVGIAHTPFGRPLMTVLRRAACPVDFGAPQSVGAIEASRQRAIVPFKGDEPAHARPALGFALGATTRADVARWASSHELACRADGPATLTCKGVPAGALPAPHDAAATSISLRWDASEKLVAAIVTRAGVDADDAVRMTEAITHDIATSAGPPTRRSGEASVAYLGPSLRQLRSEFRYRDYHAEILATRIGTGVLVSEEYQTID